MAPIIPVDVLEMSDQKIRHVIEAARDGVGDVDDEVCRPALRYYRLFSNETALRDAGLGVLEPAARFYNRYYWFSKFVKLFILRHGPNAGLEQQLFQLLEYPGFDLDWLLIEKIDNRVDAETSAVMS